MKNVKIIFIISLLLICFSSHVINAQVRLNVRVGNPHPYGWRRYYNAQPVYYQPLPPPVYAGPPAGKVWVNPHWRYDRWGNSVIVPGHWRRW